MGVFIPMPDWKKLKKYYSELEKLEYEAPTKKQLITELKEAVQELKAIEPGTQKPRPLADPFSLEHQPSRKS